MRSDGSGSRLRDDREKRGSDRDQRGDDDDRGCPCHPAGIPVFVATNTINVAMELSPRKDIRLFVTGGELHGGWFSLVGPPRRNGLREYVLRQGIPER